MDSLTLLWLISELWGVLSWLSLGHGSAHQLLPKAADGGQGIQILSSPWEHCLCMDGHHSITGCGIKDAAFSEGRRDASSALCHARRSERDQMVQWRAAFPGQGSPTCTHLSLTGSCQQPLHLQRAQLSRSKSQDSSSLLGEAVVESGEPAASTCHCHNVQQALCAWLREQGAQ